MNYISKNHRRISEYLSNREILTNPEKYFGPNYKILLNAWIIQENPRVRWNTPAVDSNCTYTEACKVVGPAISSWCGIMSREIIAAHLILAAGKDMQLIPTIEVT
jgi:hypothetical protein